MRITKGAEANCLDSWREKKDTLIYDGDDKTDEERYAYILC